MVPSNMPRMALELGGGVCGFRYGAEKHGVIGDAVEIQRCR
jgi:hypothetical protein